MAYQSSFRLDLRRNSNLKQTFFYEYEEIVFMCVYYFCYRFELNFGAEKWSLATIDYKTNEMQVIDYHSAISLIQFQQQEQQREKQTVNRLSFIGQKYKTTNVFFFFYYFDS